MGEHFSSSSRDLVGSFLHTLQSSLHILIMKIFAIIAFVGYTQAFLVRRELMLRLMPMLMLDMDMELLPPQQFLLQCVTLSQRKCARIEPLRPQEKFATLNMMRLLTPPSLNIVKRLSPPSANRSAPRADTALLL